MSIWTGPTFLTAFKVLLDARAGLDDVTVYTAPPGLSDDPNNLAAEAIVFGDIVGTQEWKTIGPERREDNYRVDCVVAVLNTDGHDEAAAVDARDRAGEILAEVEEALRGDPAVGATVILTSLSDIKLLQGNDPQGRFALIRFSVKVKSKG